MLGEGGEGPGMQAWKATHGRLPLTCFLMVCTQFEPAGLPVRSVQIRREAGAIWGAHTEESIHMWKLLKVGPDRKF